ncbi:MAG: UPF0758 domain-containing protein [Bradymonadia bacterium]
MVSLKQLPAHMRPRERLLDAGSDTLEDAELLALILGTGRGSGEDALMLAERLLATVGGLSCLPLMQMGALLSISGIGPAKGARLRALCELSRRMHVESPRPTSEPAPEPAPDPIELCVARMRGQIPTGETAVLGYCPEPGRAPVTLALGEDLGAHTRPGALLARLLQAPSSDAWWVVAIRPSGKPRDEEKAVAERLMQGASLVGLPIERVLLISGHRHWALR